MGLIARLYNIIIARHPQLAETIEVTKISIKINNCTIKAFPSNHIDAVRALDYPIYFLYDEADFSEQKWDDANHPKQVIERYVPKSNPWIVLVSTPNVPGGLFHNMDLDPDSTYKTFRFNYEWGMNKIYTTHLIEEAKKRFSFEREYNLKYGVGIGNIFEDSWINLALEKGKILKQIPVSKYTKKSMGLDPAWSSSKFGITLIEYLPFVSDSRYNFHKRVFYSKEFDKAIYAEMLDKCYKFYKDYNVEYIFCDGSQTDFIRSLKDKIGENIYYEDMVKRAKEYHTPLTDYMTVIPLLNQEWGAHLIENAKHFMGKSQTVAIDEDNCNVLVGQMRIAQQKEDGRLDKNPTTTKVTGTLDAFESYLYAMNYFTHT